jgi:transcriptional regulator with XRE-family HTH domain
MASNFNKRFVEWLAQTRKSRNLDVRGLSGLAGVPIGSISKIENGLSGLTIATVAQLCYGLGISFTEFVKIFDVPAPQLELPDSFQPAENILTVSDIEAFLEFYQSEVNAAKEFLYQGYQPIFTAFSKEWDSSSEYQAAAELVYRATRAAEDEYRPLPYPANISIDIILNALVVNAPTISQDAGVLVRFYRTQQGLTLIDLEKLVSVSKSTLSRLEIGEAERLQFEDIKAIDKELQVKGKIVQAFWNNAELQTGIVRNRLTEQSNQSPLKWEKDEWKLVDTFIKICRRQQSFSPENTTWLNKLRSMKFYYAVIDSRKHEAALNYPKFLDENVEHPQIKRALAAYTIDILKEHIPNLSLGDKGIKIFRTPENVVSLWNCILAYCSNDVVAKGIVNQLVKSPNEEDLVIALRAQILNVLFLDPKFGPELQNILKESAN